MFGKKKTPAIKIPNTLIKKEASKMVKKMIADEKKKERKKALKEKAKLKAKKTINKRKSQDKDWEDYYDEGLQKDVCGSILIFLAIIFVGIFMSEAPISDLIADKLQQFFGIGAYLLPVFFLGLGSKYIITKEKLIIPPTRVFAFLFFFAATCGIINLFTPLDESLAYSPTYGGGLGFAFGFIFRQFFGEMVAWIVLIGIFWLAGTVAFGIKISDILRLIKNGGKLESRETLETETNNGFKIVNKSTTATKKIATNEPELKYAKTKRFQNEVKIIDSSEYQDKSKKTGQKTSISLDKKDDKDQLSKAKNQKFGDWEPPSLDLLKTQNATITVDEKKLRQKAESIREKLEQFNIEVIMRSVHVGPTVTQFTLEPAAGVKLTKITALRADLA